MLKPHVLGLGTGNARSVKAASEQRISFVWEKLMAHLARQHLDDIDEAELMRRFEHALDHMNKHDRWVFLCHRVDELPYSEIAEIGGISVDEVMQAMMRALTHLRKTWDEDYFHPVRKWWQFWEPW